MSLVNDMLRDLDARDGKPQYSNSAINAGYSRDKSPAWRYITIGFVAVLALCLLLLLTWQNFYPAVSGESEFAQQRSQSLRDVDSVKDIPVRADASNALSVKLEPAPDFNSAVFDAENTNANSESERHSVRDNSANSNIAVSALEENLIKAKTALLADQLTQPVDASAYLFYQKALSIAPENPEAMAGLRDIADRYATLAERQLASGNRGAAQTMLDRADGIWPGLQRVALLQRQLDDSTANPTAINQVSDTVSVPSAEGLAPSAEAQTAPVKPTASELKKVDQSQAKLQTAAVTQTLRSLDAEQLKAAQQLRQQGQTLEAEQQLHTFLSNRQEKGQWPEQSRRALQGWYLAKGDTTAARHLISNELPQSQSAFLQAQLDNAQGQYQEAIIALESQLAATSSEDEQYRALMASVYQRLDRSAEAQAYYSRLLEVFGDKARYWLGLAVALDKQGNYSAAAAAYRRAQSSADTSTTIENFTRQRLAQLEQ